MGCMNLSCGASTSIEWKRGWALRSGGFANLCDKCGSAYEQSIFCDVFHSTESGWRECTSCGKRLHCGCVASSFLVEQLDIGGVKCSGCAKSLGAHPANGLSTSKLSDLQQVSSNDHFSNVDKMKLVQLGNHAEGSAFRHLLQPQNDGTNVLFPKMKLEDVPPSFGEFRRANMDANYPYEASPHTNLTMALGSSLVHPNPFPGAMVDDREHVKPSSMFIQGARSRQVLPKPPRSTLAPSMEANSSMVPQVRVARPPAEGRGRNQLLPRYWPRITDQELQQISGDSNATIVPLFEKMLSASDAGRIGRLVLPKACAEAYFPPISQPEGLPLKIQDVKGKEWIFQFRFWPNNNSRMYVLEGVTPCIQSMQLQAGDTVTFSRMDPEGKLIMGFRKAANSVVMQDTHQSAIHNGSHSNDTFFPGVFENLPIISGYSGLLQSLKGSSETHLHALPKHMSSTGTDISWNRAEKNEGKAKDGSLWIPERKRVRNIGPKIKRLHINSQDALEVRLSWDEAQDLLRPPPSSQPTTVVIEDHEFEEYEEPPVLAKRSIFVARLSGEQEQWAQCDNCSKWRRLPVDVLLPQKWTCVDNAWDQSRCSCSVPDELAPQELESLLRQNNEFKRQRTMLGHETESPVRDTLATGVMLRDASAEPAGPTTATTTKHPRHRPGCSCIVCIQPPSGKGKHKPSCTCNVCMTVKRRFKTLMLNKKKRQSEREAEMASRTAQRTPGGSSGPRDEAEVESSSRHVSDNEARSASEPEAAKEALDLNSDPGRELSRMSMVSLLHAANHPLESYLKQNGLASLAEQDTSTTQIMADQEQESEAGPNQSQNDQQ